MRDVCEKLLAILLVAAAVSALWHLPMATIGCIVLVTALLVTISAPQLSAMWARFPLPAIPAPGDPTPTPPSLRVLEDLPRRVRISDAHQTGFIAGAVLLSVLGSLAIAGQPNSVSGWAWYLVAATSAASVLRARVWDTVGCKTWLLAQPFLVVGQRRQRRPRPRRPWQQRHQQHHAGHHPGETAGDGEGEGLGQNLDEDVEALGAERAADFLEGGFFAGRKFAGRRARRRRGSRGPQRSRGSSRRRRRPARPSPARPRRGARRARRHPPPWRRSRL